MKQSLEQRMSQSLVMTQQLQQSIKLLQYSAAELAEFVASEVEKNPLLSSEEGENEADAPSAASRDDHEEGEGSASDLRDSVAVAQEGFDATSDLDAGQDAMWGEAGDGGDHHAAAHYEEQFGENYGGAGGGRGLSGDEDHLSDIIEQRHSEQKTLREHVLEQVLVDCADAKQQMLAMLLVDMLDEQGYLRESTAQLAVQLACTPEEIESVVLRLQACDPCGVAARDLAECLRLQLRERDRLDPAMQALLANLSLVAEGEYKKLMKLCKVDEEDLRDMLAELRTLNPYPASAFVRAPVESVVPEVMVRQIGQELRVELNHDVLPKVLLNKHYYADLQKGARDKEEKKFVAEQFANANWLLKAMDQRAQTLLKVSAEIVRQQQGFFQHGIHHLKPLTLLQVAQEVGLHESSVSRVTANKYMLTPRGTFELKYFFSSSLGASRGGEDFSSRSVMQMIKDMIEKEKIEDVLSDDTIAEALKQRGVDVARRTVVKYRTAMKIPSSVERRRLKKQMM